MTADVINEDLKTSLRRLRLSPILTTLANRLALARKKRMPHQDFCSCCSRTRCLAGTETQ